MGPMDVADVSYDRFLVNGQRFQEFKQGKMHQKVRIRIINASASTYFKLGMVYKR
jgi:FtsP/CotA-like multicopper oxidase with cupredoxin domain